MTDSCTDSQTSKYPKVENTFEIFDIFYSWNEDLDICRSPKVTGNTFCCKITQFCIICFSGVDAVVCWTVYVLLLQDEDVDVRQTASSALTHLHQYIQPQYHGKC